MPFPGLRPPGVGNTPPPAIFQGADISSRLGGSLTGDILNPFTVFHTQQPGEAQGRENPYFDEDELRPIAFEALTPGELKKYKYNKTNLKYFQGFPSWFYSANIAKEWVKYYSVPYELIYAICRRPYKAFRVGEHEELIEELGSFAFGDEEGWHLRGRFLSEKMRTILRFLHSKLEGSWRIEASTAKAEGYSFVEFNERYLSFLLDGSNVTSLTFDRYHFPPIKQEGNQLYIGSLSFQARDHDTSAQPDLFKFSLPARFGAGGRQRPGYSSELDPPSAERVRAQIRRAGDARTRSTNMNRMFRERDFRANLALETMMERKGPYALPAPENWSSYHRDREEALVLAFKDELKRRLKRGRHLTDDVEIGPHWLLSIEIPLVKSNGQVTDNVVVSMNNTPIVRSTDVNKPAVEERIRAYVTGSYLGQENYFEQDVQRIISSKKVLPVIYTFAEHEAKIPTRGGALQNGSVISFIFRHMTSSYLQRCVRELENIHDLVLPKSDLLVGSNKHCLIRAIITCYLIDKESLNELGMIKKSLNKYTNTFARAMRRKGVDLEDQTFDSLIENMKSVKAIPTPRRIYLLADRGIGTFGIKCIDGARMSDWDAHIWLMDGNTHALPLIRKGNRYAVNREVMDKVTEPPSFEVDDLLPIIGDKRPTFTVTFDYETLNPERCTALNDDVFIRDRRGERMSELHESPVEDYMVSWCIKDNRELKEMPTAESLENSINPSDWEVGYSFRNDHQDPTHIFLRKLCDLVKRTGSGMIHCWAHNNEFDMPLFLMSFLEWYKEARFLNQNVVFSLPDIMPRNNKFIKVTLKAWPVGFPKEITRIVFKDSYKLLPAPLAGLCASMNVPEEYTKGEIDHRAIRTMDDVRDNEFEIIHYSKNDVISLMYILSIFEKRIVELGLTQPHEDTYKFIVETADDMRKELEDGNVEDKDREYYQRLVTLGDSVEMGATNWFPLAGFTVAGLSRSILKLNCFHLLQKERFSLTLEDDEKFRQAYHGGRVQCFRLGYVEKSWLSYLDFTSLYPTTMTLPLIYGQPTEVDPAPFEDDEEGIAKVRFYIKHGTKGHRLPIIMSDVPGRGLVPKQPDIDHPLEEYVTSCELKHALANGYVVTEYLEKYVFKCEAWLRPLVRKLYRMKLEAEECEDAVGRQIAKLLLNSLYGFWALKNEGSAVNLCTTSVDLLKRQGLKDPRGELDRLTMKLWKRQFGHKLIRMAPISEKFLMYEERMTTQTAYQNVAIAAWITALARIKIWNLIDVVYDAGFQPMYCDTDSVIFDAPHAIDVNFGNLLTSRSMPLFGQGSPSNELGCITNEFEGKFMNSEEPWRDYATHGAFCGLKQYALWTEKAPEKGKMALKGIPVDKKTYAHSYDTRGARYFIENGKGHVKITPHDIRDLANGTIQNINVLFTGFITGLSNIWTQPYTPSGEADYPLKEMEGLTKNFSLRFIENTRKCSVEYMKGPLFREDGTPFERDPHTAKHFPGELSDYLRTGKQIVVGYYQTPDQLSII